MLTEYQRTIRTDRSVVVCMMSPQREVSLWAAGASFMAMCSVVGTVGRAAGALSPAIGCWSQRNGQRGNISSPKTFDLNGLPRSASRSSSRSPPVFRCVITVDIPVSLFSGRVGLLELGVLHTERAGAHVDVLISKIIQRAPSTMPCCHTNISLSKLRLTSRSRLLCGSVLTSRFNRRLPFHLQDRDRAHSAS